MRTLTNNKPWETWFFMRGKFEHFTGGWVSCCWVPKRDDAGRSENCMPRCNALKNGHPPERKSWALYRRVSKQSPEKRASSWEGGLSSLPEGEWSVAESLPKRDDAGWSENYMSRCNALKTGIFPIGRVELFTGGWVSCCWVPKRDDAGNGKNDCMADKENRKGAT